MAKRILCIALNVLSALALLGTIAFLILYWQRIPDTVPMHFDAKGQIDGRSAKIWLLLLPVINAIALASLSFSKTVRVRTLGHERRIPAPPLLFAAMKLTLSLGLSYLTVCSALSRPLGAWFLPVFLIAVLLPLAVFGVITARQ